MGLLPLAKGELEGVVFRLATMPPEGRDHVTDFQQELRERETAHPPDECA
jgi:hypothetical protein